MLRANSKKRCISARKPFVEKTLRVSLMVRRLWREGLLVNS
jgi:hypothetical protein